QIGHVDERILLLPDLRRLAVAHDPDDLDVGAGIAAAEAQACAQWSPAGEEAARGGLVDHGDFRGTVVIPPRDLAPRDQRDPESREVAGADPVASGVARVSGEHLGAFDAHVAAADVSSESGELRGADRPDS